MKKTIQIFLFVLLGAGLVQAQSLTPTVIASAGGYASGGNVSLSWTLGELAVTTLSSGNFMLTQGFQQPWELDISNAIDDPSYDWAILSYPNPVHDQLNLKFKVEKVLDYNVEITDLTGKTLHLQKVENVTPGQEVDIDFSPYPQGLYLVKITSTDRKYQRTVRVQKY